MKLFALFMVAAVVVITVIANVGLGATAFAFVHDVPGADLTLHFGLYALLGLAVVAWIWERVLHPGWRLLCVSVLVLLVAVEELSQNFLASRNFSWLDLGSSLAGLLTGVLISAWWVSRRSDSGLDLRA
ncbi:MAG: VanZ family protein [Thermoanaerobaculia bacterium]|nr:VanZ family protein [Thermoanaerobaculia bacterium]